MKKNYPKLSLRKNALIIEFHHSENLRWSNYLDVLLDFDKETMAPSAIEIIDLAGHLGLETINFTEFKLENNDLHWKGYYDAEYDIFYIAFKKNLKAILKTEPVKGRVSINQDNGIDAIEILDYSAKN